MNGKLSALNSMKADSSVVLNKKGVFESLHFKGIGVRPGAVGLVQHRALQEAGGEVALGRLREVSAVHALNARQRRGKHSCVIGIHCNYAVCARRRAHNGTVGLHVTLWRQVAHLRRNQYRQPEQSNHRARQNQLREVTRQPNQNYETDH